jgi:hypothetical protein
MTDRDSRTQVAIERFARVLAEERGHPQGQEMSSDFERVLVREIADDNALTQRAITHAREARAADIQDMVDNGRLGRGPARGGRGI